MIALQPEMLSKVYGPLILLVVALAVALMMAHRVWTETHEEEGPVDDQDVLDDLEQAYASGDLNAEEMRRVREVLGGSTPLAKDDAPPDRAREGM